MAGYKVASDAIVIANQKENTNIQDFQSQAADPLSTVREATRQTLFSSKQTEVTERIAEVVAVVDNIILPAELSYFGEEQISLEYNEKKWYCAICRILDLHGVTPDPDIIVQQSNGNNTFKDITRMRANVGKFYCPVEFLQSKGRTKLKVGNWVIVEFQDKTLLTNGIIKDIYVSPDLSKEEEQARNANSASSAFGAGRSTAYADVQNRQPPTGAKYINPIADQPTSLTSIYSDTRVRERNGRKVRELHQGVDIVNANTNQAGVTPIYSIATGRVRQVYADPNGTLGYGIWIDHDDGTSAKYGHFYEPLAFTSGQQVSIGTQLGLMGNTGPTSTGVHLHLEIRDSTGNTIDPTTAIDFTSWVPGNPPRIYEESPTVTETPNLDQSDISGEMPVLPTSTP